MLGWIASFFDVLDCHVQDGLHSHSVYDRSYAEEVECFSFSVKNSFRLFGNKAWLVNVNFATMFVKFLLIGENLLALEACKRMLDTVPVCPSSLEHWSLHGSY